MRGTGQIGLLALLAAGPARAECLGSCANDLAAAVFSLIAYGLIGLVLLVMLIRRKWRRAGLWGLGIVVVLAVAVPLLSQAWVAWKLRAVEAREIVGTPPALTTRKPLLITPDDYCEANACEAVMTAVGASGVHVLRTRLLDGMDLARPVPLAELPLELWTLQSTSGEVDRRDLSEAERQAAATELDYLVVTTWPYYRAEPGPIEAALRSNPALAGMGQAEAVRLMLAPLDPAEGTLSLTTLMPDVLDLDLADRALAIPLAPRNLQGAGNSPAGVDAAAQAICPAGAATFATCRSLLEW